MCTISSATTCSSLVDIPSDLWTRWHSSDQEVSKQAFKEIEGLGQGALPVLRKAIATGSSQQFAACRRVLEMHESDVRELILPLFEKQEKVTWLWSVIAEAKAALPYVWPYLTATLRESDSLVRGSGLQAVQSQITRAKIEELCLDAWADELKGPLTELLAEHNGLCVLVAELIARLPLKSEAIGRALEANILWQLDEKQAGWLPYLAKALIVQELSNEAKANVLGDIMRRGINSHDRYAVAMFAAKMGVSAHYVLSDCQNVLDFIRNAGSQNWSPVQVRRLREALDSMQGAKGKDSAERGNPSTHPRLRMWMDAMGTLEHACSNSKHSLGWIAREQIRRSRDESLVGPVIESLSGKTSPDQYGDLLFVVDCLLTNTGNAELRDWLRHECSRVDLKREQIFSLLYVKQSEVMPMVRRVLFANNAVYASRCLEHLARDASDESVDLLCEVGRRAPSIRLLVIFALMDSRSQRAIPYLLELAKQEPKSKKGDELEWRAYAIIGLGKLGDSRVVPELCELAEQFSMSGAVLRALADLGDSRGLLPAIKAVRKILAKPKILESWSKGNRTPVYDLFLLARKSGLLEHPELVALVLEIGRNGVWDKLLPEDRNYLTELHCTPWEHKNVDSSKGAYG